MKKVCLKKSVKEYSIWILLGIIFFFFVGEKGYCLMQDSEHYIKEYVWGNLGIAPLYPMFLSVCKYIFGEQNYLSAAYVLQGILAISSSMYLAAYLKKTYSLSTPIALVCYFCTFFPYGYTLPEMVASHTILTEALAIPIFHVFITFMIKGCYETSWKEILKGGPFLILLLTVRTHFIFFLLIYLGIFLYVYFEHNKNIGKSNKVFFYKLSIGAGILLCSAIVLIKGFNINVYHYAGQGLTALSGRLLCLIDIEDEESFETELDKKIFRALYEEIDANELRIEYFREGIWRWQDIANSCNRNFIIEDGVLNHYYEEELKTFGDVQNWGEKKVGIAKVLLKNHFGEYLITILQLMAASLVSTVFFQIERFYAMCYFITFGLYLGSSAIWSYGRKIKKVEKVFFIPIKITLLVTVINVGLTNIMFYGMQRYVIYTFGLFYLSNIIMLVGIYRESCLQKCKTMVE